MGFYETYMMIWRGLGRNMGHIKPIYVAILAFFVYTFVGFHISFRLIIHYWSMDCIFNWIGVLIEGHLSTSIWPLIRLSFHESLFMTHGKISVKMDVLCRLDFMSKNIILLEMILCDDLEVPVEVFPFYALGKFTW